MHRAFSVNLPRGKMRGRNVAGTQGFNTAFTSTRS